MKPSRVIMLIGSVISTLGIIFQLQGQSIIGPESSFMYANPGWISYGIQITIAGIIILVIGIFLKFQKLI